jgi:hypothetical protein
MAATRHKKLLAALLAVELLVLVVQIGRRVAFPWDLILWSESPFLTDMLKLHHGEPLYGPAADASSFVYAPGLAWITYALLRPFGLHVEIVACRLVTVTLGLLAAALATRAMRTWPAGAPSRTARLGCFAIAVLVVFKSFTADVPHPDNLHLLHFAATLWLALGAVKRSDARWAMLAAAVGGLGVLAKQTAAVAFVGTIGGLALSGRFRGRALVPAALVGCAVAAAATAVLLVPTWSRFWTWSLVAQHEVGWKGSQLLFEVAQAPHRLVLWVAGAWSMAVGWRGQPDRRASLAVLGGALVLGALPTMAAYMKIFGGSNNLTVIDLWALVASAPLVWSALEAPQAERGLVAAVLAVTLVPTRYAPTESLWGYARDLDAAIADDLRQGRRVLVGHGTTFQIRAGDLSVPRDRANSMLELTAGGRAHLAGIFARIEAHHYDRIYLNSIWYDGAVQAAVSAAYRIERRIEPAADVPPFVWGWQNLATGTVVVRPRAEGGGRAVPTRPRSMR